MSPNLCTVDFPPLFFSHLKTFSVQCMCRKTDDWQEPTGILTSKIVEKNPLCCGENHCLLLSNFFGRDACNSKPHADTIDSLLARIRIQKTCYKFTLATSGANKVSLNSNHARNDRGQKLKMKQHQSKKTKVR